MVCTADDILGWRDFPKGLRVLLLDEDTNSVAEIKSKLENMDYIVSTFCNENEALAAISNKPKSFHVAIVEVNTGNRHGSYRFLKTAIGIPIVMTSNIHCLSTMMKCIALGAAEFLQKPLSEDKLRNIWQHVVQKAFNAGGSAVSKSLKSIKETIVSRLHLQVETIKPENENQLETDVEAQAHKHDHEQSAASDGLPAPLTPQLKQGGRLLDEGYFQDNPNCGSMEKEYLDQEGESKSVEISCNNSVVKVNVEVDPSPGPGVAVIKEEDDSTEGSKTGSNVSSHLQDKDSVADSIVEARNPRKSSLLPTSCGIDNRKKMKVDWTPELHKRFVHAIEQLGVDQAIPSRILDLMKIEGLTRHNVASHLQKYRMHQRHIMPKEDNRRWHHPRYSVQREYGNKPIMAFPPYHPSHGFSTNQMYPVWGHPSSLPSSVQTWGHHGFPTWQPPEIWLQKMYTEMHANAWGCPLVPTPHGPCSTFPQNSWGSHSSNAIQDTGSLLRNSFELHPAEEVIDNVVKEAISKRWLPLPLGLKPPSIESVLSELHGQDSSNVPHTTANSC